MSKPKTFSRADRAGAGGQAMNDRLLELAESAGVATWGPSEPIPTDSGPRPRLDIAMNLLAQLSGSASRYHLGWAGGEDWSFYDHGKGPDHETYGGSWFVGTFEECVVALTERAQEDKS